jgi:hypothetical protein
MFKFTAIVAALAATVVALPNELNERACGGDNCFNQVSATRYGTMTLASRLADCSSYLESTVTPEASTVITTIATSTTTLTVSSDAIPAYASGCANNDLKYRSACLCASVEAPIVTAPVPTITSVVQVLATEYFPAAPSVV